MNIIIERTIELNAPLLTEPLPGSLFTTESKAHQFLIGCTQNGAPVTLSGTVSAKFIREANNTTILMSGSISGGKASLILPADCYNISGRFDLTIFVTSNNVTTCIYSATGSVKAAQDGTLVDEGTVVPSIEQLQQDVTNLQNNKVNRSGDTMTGTLAMPTGVVYGSGSYATLYFKNGAGAATNIGYVGMNLSTRRLLLACFAPGNDNEIYYRLPAPAQNESGGGYDILTTKQSVTALTSRSSSVAVTDGGWVKLGRVVTMSGVLSVSAAVAQTVAMLEGLPRPIGDYAELVLVKSDRTISGTARITASVGFVYPNFDMTAGTYYISGSYISYS